MAAFFESLGGKAAERWSAALFAPAVLFWTGGLVAWIIDEGSWDESGQRIIGWLDALSGVEQVLVVIGALLVMTASDTIVRQLTLPLLRVLEGYGLRRLSWLTAYESGRLDRASTKLEPLWAKHKESSLSAEEQDTLSTLAVFVRRFPEASRSRMPTRLGNVLRAGELLARSKYGLDAVICWPRLWLVLDDDVKSELTEARRQLDQTVAVLVWGLLLAAWVFLTPLVLLPAAGVSVFAYWWAVQRAKVFVDLVEATYDVHRMKLYEALRLPKPRKPSEEPSSGQLLTGYLWWGKVSDEDLEFVVVKEGREDTPRR